jgi:hypothetical protein
LVTEDGLAILNTWSGQITTLNSTGAYIWQRLEQGQDVATITVLLANETGEELSVVQQGVSLFLAELNEHRLQPC